MELPGSPFDQKGSESPTRDNYYKEIYGERDADNDPPYSRVFVVYNKDLTEEDLLGLFRQYGFIQYCRILTDRGSGEPKGVAYIKYDRASSAAVAIETLNGHQIRLDTNPLKVMIADAKGSRNIKVTSKEPEDTPPRSRLFIICSKEVTEEELLKHFETFPDLEYCKLMTDKNSKESKGCGFAKFSKASSAATAMEALNDQSDKFGFKMKVLIADPKTKRSKEGIYTRDVVYPLFAPRSSVFVPSFAYPEYGGLIPNPYMVSYTATPYNSNYQNNSYAVSPVTISSPRNYPQLASELNLNQVSQMGSQQGQLPTPYAVIPVPMVTSQRYIPFTPSSPQAIPRQRLYIVCDKSITQEQLARHFARFPGMEYCDLKLDKKTNQSKGFAYVNYSTIEAAMMAKQFLDGTEFPPGSGRPMKVIYAEPLGPKLGSIASPPRDTLSLSAMRDSFAQMMNFQNQMGGQSFSDLERDRNYPEGSRLFIVLMGAPLSENSLSEIFAPFGGLEFVRLQKDKNYGYVKYTTAQAAQNAASYLDGLEHNGTRLKVQIASPVNEVDSRKRQRT